ncbi:hypothetical protein [Cryobacterium sp. CG_9.6]|uniref:hypothetical protein n=1 Tax=Cryobacterium sp. CG_9.6 TaxID=2760710 RepID=UPI00247527AA|nr:hypothetical protein [Cryobacterium sp. CG_9.6]MDH6238140.1 hypothetical protein [Cryobacterium sp. CG_9.6]
MNQSDLFLQADAALRSVIDRLTSEHLALATPADWSRTPNPTLRDVLATHARDEAWVPDVLAGRTIEDAGTEYDGDLLGDDPITSYDRLNDVATAAVTAVVNPEATVHLSYGDFAIHEYLQHAAFYRAFQAWSIAHLARIDFSLGAPLVDMLWDQIVPVVREWRAMGVFPPAVAMPSHANREIELLALTGYWVADDTD